MNTRFGTALPPALIVSVSAGTGHVRAGEALRTAFDDVGYSRVEHVDVLDLAPRWVRTAYGGGFELVASRAPGVWRGVYRLSDGPDGDDAKWGPIAHRVLFRAFRRLLLSERWAFCASTHFLPGQLAAGLPGHPPIALVVTDFMLHRYWVQPRVREYFVATRDTARALRQRLPNADALATGIPVAAAFARPAERTQARVKYDISADSRVALVMGGGLGIGVEANVRAALDARVPGLQIVAVCGRNRTAYERLRSLAVPEAQLRVHGYADDVAGIIAASDVVVTKPGGLTCSETLALGRPLVLTRAIPGHEEANVRYLTARGAAVSAPATADVGPALRSILLDAGTYRHAADAAREIGTPFAARDIALAMTQHHVLRAVA